MKAVLKALLLLLLVIAVSAVVTFIWIGSRGISAKVDPGPVETAVARTMRRLAVPRADRDRPNPVKATPGIIAAGMAHYADHCAACHANDGSGETEIGLGLYPKAPDMRKPATQQLTDGELFYIIENGVRLTGMPAWSTGTKDGTEQTWHLVHFIRHLPTITEDDVEKMKALNPRSPEEIRQEIEAERFLSGESPAPSSPVQPNRGAGHVHE
jgi:mono/diheme cytochrome c family protein